MNGRQPKVFVSYSHQDEEWKELLVTQLSVLQSQELLEVWDDRQIAAGADWYRELITAIDLASLVVILISADFLTSPFILREEVPRFLRQRAEQGLRVVPTLVRPRRQL